MSAHSEKMARPTEFTRIKREAYRRDPAANALLEVLPMDSPVFGQALFELIRLQKYDIEITPELARKVGKRFAQYAEREPRDDTLRQVEGQVVYYIRIGNRIKIGTTTNMAARMSTLNPEEILVVEPGGVEVERRRHDEFRHLRTHGEWFRYEDTLAVHIEQLRESADGAPG